MATYHPKRKKCRNCGGKKWFPSAIGLIGCQMCDATGEGGIDVDWLVKDWQRLKGLEEKEKGTPEWLSQALNEGNGTYKP